MYRTQRLNPQQQQQQQQHAPLANHIPGEVSVSSDASLTLKGLSLSLCLSQPLVFYIIFPRAVRLHAPGFYKGGSTVNIRPKVAPSCEAVPS